MARPVGSPKYGGRTKGTLNKNTRDLLAQLDDLEFNPAEALAWVHKEALRQYEETEDTLAIIEKEIEGDNGERVFERKELKGRRAEFLRIVESSAAQVMQYTHPKRKAVEHSVDPESKIGFTPVVLYVPDNGRGSKKD